ncbi:MAG: Txe/YoeB family addiction module toxin [Bacteroidia bacterium]
MKRKLAFEPDAFKEFQNWILTDKKTTAKIFDLLEEIFREPFKGKGKPEPLKHLFKGYWSRRINDEHRLIYKVTDDEIIIISCKHHYV